MAETLTHTGHSVSKPVENGPSVHAWDRGVPIESDVVIPAAVGVDIGCGMIAAPLRPRRSELSDLRRVRSEIERLVPVERTNRGQAGDRGAWGAVPQDVRAV